MPQLLCPPVTHLVTELNRNSTVPNLYPNRLNLYVWRDFVEWSRLVGGVVGPFKTGSFDRSDTPPPGRLV